MLQLWTDYGFYLWILTTLLAVVALAWLAYNTFTGQGDGEAEAAPGDSADPASLAGMDERLTALAEAAPHMQATLGRTLQYVGLMRYADGSGAQAFALAISNARGDGFVLSSSVRGGLSAKPLSRWAANQPLSMEEQSAIEQARGGQEKS